MSRHEGIGHSIKVGGCVLRIGAVKTSRPQRSERDRKIDKFIEEIWKK